MCVWCGCGVGCVYVCGGEVWGMCVGWGCMWVGGGFVCVCGWVCVCGVRGRTENLKIHGYIIHFFVSNIKTILTGI